MLSNVYFQDVKPGDVLQKKNMWEIIGEGSAGERPGLEGKVNIQKIYCSDNLKIILKKVELISCLMPLSLFLLLSFYIVGLLLG